MKKRYLITSFFIGVLIFGLVVFSIISTKYEKIQFSESTFSDTFHENSKVTIKYPQINKVNKIIKDLAENLPADSNSSDYINGDLFQFTEGTFKDTSHENSEVNVKYPQINNGEYLEVNKIIKNFAESLPSDYYPYDYKNLSLDITYKIPYESEDYLSVVFEGGGYVRTAAHPNGFIYAININLTDESIVSFSDIYTVNSEVEQIVKDEFCDQFPTSKLKEIGIDSNDESYEEEKENLLYGSSMWLRHINDILNGSSGFYFSKDGVVESQ